MTTDGDGAGAGDRPENSGARPPGRKTLADLIMVMAALRTPGTGCPWDLQQDFASIAPYTLEEAYEVVDAIERGDMADLREELGDLLLQVVYHARMAEEAGEFAIDDVIDGITRKMVRRHPHVFGDHQARDVGDVDGLWRDIKAGERRRKAEARGLTVEEYERAGRTLFGDVPATHPALVRAQKLQKRAGEVGYDWPGVAPILTKVREEIAELESAMAGDDPVDMEEEVGDLLFSVVNVARHLDIDAESALRRANAKFIGRIDRIAAEVRDTGRDLEDLNDDERDRLWQQTKREPGPN